MLRKYRKNSDGNVAMMFGATALLVLALVGFAVDYNGITASKVKYQAMADAAVLMAAGSGVQDEAELQALAEQVVAAHNYESETLITDLSILEDNTLRVEVSAQKQLAIMSMFGAPTPTVRVGSESPPKGDVKLNLALVLDVTGSMEGTKITTLKSAATTPRDLLVTAPSP
ncbi:MAG: pilus assembly protein, partial [Acidimicrobiales bacterium]